MQDDWLKIGRNGLLIHKVLHIDAHIEKKYHQGNNYCITEL